MMNILIPMAGLGSRFSAIGISTPKPLILVGGKTLIERSIETLGLSGRYIYITRTYADSIHNVRLTDIFKRLTPNFIEIRVGSKQFGAADTSLYAKQYIDNDSELIITNCDQILRWNPQSFLDFVDSRDPDGAVVIYNSDNPKNSFAKIENGIINEIAEKVAISRDALIGVHYWKHGSDFVRSAEHLVDNFKSFGLPEAYISTTYNYLINNNKTILPWNIKDSGFIPIGTPEDVGVYLLRQENK